MEIGREPNPQPAPPLPSGAFGREQKIKLFAVLVGLIIFLAIAIGLLWPKKHTYIVGPNRIAQQPQSQPQYNPISLDLEKEKAYEEGKREAAKQYLGVANATTQQAQTVAPYVVPARVANPEAQATVEKASFSDNMVTNGRFGLERNAGANADRVGSDDDVHAAPSGDSSRNSEKDSAAVDGQVLPEGTLIYCALVNQLSGDNTGPVKAQVSNDVYFPGTRIVAIPQGSIVLGEAQKVGAQFQQRLAVSFHVLQVGNRQIKLDKMPGLDQQGAAALHDKTDNHYLQTFGASMAVGAIGGLSQIGNGSYGGVNGYDSTTQVRNGISQSMAQSSAQILSHFLNRMPTITIRPGTPVVVYLTGNVEIPQ